ncbi:V-type ATP synthase subunit F [Streptomyces sp. XD-27]|uniref:V-type ATP synthase subunit F n=1 Tax=Streptomyces sp. XD-27 TaxID=3062779 RepID=UPI0026F42757|nr:V-type ATP synthase subunit F [Streptomyces sp. XD-27]WKX69015.1 V-type ATP synthase subunit F [Streptomyces sp. XD-27]
MAAIGERVRVSGFALAGVTVYVAEDPAAVREAWRTLPADTGLVIVTPAAADALGTAPLEETRPLTAVMPP